ncbi:MULTISPECIES: methyltransferase domain-containing protein [unclassified Aeromicrobium]|uniref:methyltransferase domain-containing protein n=1 Tax=unclassified Aeromicrobium TaxID=2633570 RepID=UPI00396B0F74
MDAMSSLSPRLAAVLEALPLAPGLRVLEVGGAPGPLARAMAARVSPGGFVLVVDRSERGVAATRTACSAEIAAGVLGVRLASAEAFRLEPGEAPFDLAVANRVGALDGRHPALEDATLAALRAATTPGAPLYVDGRRVASGS